MSDQAKEIRERMQKEYKPSEWTPCPGTCSYCTDPFYGHSLPHESQIRVDTGEMPWQYERRLVQEMEVTE